MNNGLLPKGFEEFEHFVSIWALPTENERNNRRWTSKMEDIQAFYDAILPKVDLIFAYLNQYKVADLPEDAKLLFYLTLSLAEIAPAVERYKVPQVRNSVDRSRFVALHGQKSPT